MLDKCDDLIYEALGAMRLPFCFVIKKPVDCIIYSAESQKKRKIKEQLNALNEIL